MKHLNESIKESFETLNESTFTKQVDKMNAFIEETTGKLESWLKKHNHKRLGDKRLNISDSEIDDYAYVISLINSEIANRVDHKLINDMTNLKMTIVEFKDEVQSLVDELGSLKVDDETYDMIALCYCELFNELNNIEQELN